MKREISIIGGKNDLYLLRSKKIKKGKEIIDIYTVDLRNCYCSCKGFWNKHKCRHFKDVIDILRAAGIGVVHDKKTKSYYTNWDYRDIELDLRIFTKLVTTK